MRAEIFASEPRPENRIKNSRTNRVEQLAAAVGAGDVERPAQHAPTKARR